MATISSPQALREAVSRKLGRAQECWYHLHQAEQPEFNKYTDPAQIVRDFLHAARGVVPVIETFADGRLQRGDFDHWRKSWEQAIPSESRAQSQLTDAERALWLQMLDERVAEEHGEGAGLEAILIAVTRGHMPQDFTNYALFRIPRPPGPSKGGVRFRAYPGRPASEVCQQYLELCQRFWQAFQAEHPHLLQPAAGC